MMPEYRKEIIRDLRTYVIDESLSNAAADEMEEMMEELEHAEMEGAALRRAITALIKVGSAENINKAKAIAMIALETMTCAGEGA